MLGQKVVMFGADKGEVWNLGPSQSYQIHVETGTAALPYVIGFNLPVGCYPKLGLI